MTQVAGNDITPGSTLQNFEQADLSITLPVILETILDDGHYCLISIPDSDTAFCIMRRENGFRVAMSLGEKRVFDTLLAVNAQGSIEKFCSAADALAGSSREELADNLRRDLIEISLNPAARKSFPRNPPAILFHEELEAVLQALKAWKGWEMETRAWREQHRDKLREELGIRNSDILRPFPEEIIEALKPLFLANGIDLVPCLVRYDRLVESRESEQHRDSREAREAGPHYKLEVLRPVSVLARRITLFKKRYSHSEVFLAPERALKLEAGAFHDEDKGVAIGIRDVEDLIYPRQAPFTLFEHELRHRREFERDEFGRCPGFFSGFQAGLCPRDDNNQSSVYRREMAFNEILAFRDGAYRAAMRLSLPGANVAEHASEILSNLSRLKETSSILRKASERALGMFGRWKARGLFFACLSGATLGISEGFLYDDKINWHSRGRGMIRFSIGDVAAEYFTINLGGKAAGRSRRASGLRGSVAVFKAARKRITELNETAEYIEARCDAILAMVDQCTEEYETSRKFPVEVFLPGLIHETSELCSWIKRKHEGPHLRGP